MTPEEIAFAIGRGWKKTPYHDGIQIIDSQKDIGILTTGLSCGIVFEFKKIEVVLNQADNFCVVRGVTERDGVITISNKDIAFISGKLENCAFVNGKPIYHYKHKMPCEKCGKHILSGQRYDGKLYCVKCFKTVGE